MGTEQEAATAAGDGGDHPVQDDVLKYLKDEVTAIANDLSSGTWGRRQDNEETRFCLWDGQSADGRKHSEDMDGTEPFPFEGAMDSRVRLADMIINERAEIMVQAAKRAHLAVTGAEITDVPKAERVKTLLRYIVRNKFKRAWRKELKKYAQWSQGDTPAVAFLYVYWWQKTGIRNVPIKLEDVVQRFMEIFPDQGWTQGDLEDITQILVNETTEAEAIAFLSALVPSVKPGRWKKILAAWRAGETAEFPQPYLVKNEPRVKACRLMEDIFIRRNTGDFEDAPVVIFRELLTKSQVQAATLERGWTTTFVEALLGDGETEKGYEGKTAFPETEWQQITENESGTARTEKDYKGLYEVLTAFRQATNEDGVQGIYKVSFHPQIQIAASPEEILDYAHGLLPFIELARETVSTRLLDSRGVPEVVTSDQAQVKILDDTMADHAQLTLPPIFVPGNRPNIPLLISPLRQIKRNRPNEYEWMQLPDYPQTTKEQRAEIRRRVSEYWGRWHPDVSPEIVKLHLQDLVDDFLDAVGDALMMVVQLCQQFLTDEEIKRITGEQGEPVAQNMDEIRGSFDLVMDFDVGTLDPEYIMKLAESLGKVILPMDREQTVMRDQLVSILVGAFNPNLADRVLQPVAKAQEKERADEELNYTKIAVGLEPAMVEDQNHPLRLQVLEEIMTKNPQAVQALSPVSQEILRRRIKHLEFMTEQMRNAQIGRVGAEPVLGQ